MTAFDSITDQLAEQAIEVPSWAYGNSGTRFRVFTTPGTPRNVFEKLADAAQVNAATGLAPKVALHYPWDKVDDWSEVVDYAREVGVELGTVNSTRSRMRPTSSVASPTTIRPCARRRSSTTWSAST